jgi:site-specific recombinase XerD
MLRDSLAVHLLEAGADQAAVWWFLGLAPLPEGADVDAMSREILAHHPRHVA